MVQLAESKEGRHAGKADKRKSGEIRTAFQGVRPCVLKYMIE